MSSRRAVVALVRAAAWACSAMAWALLAVVVLEVGLGPGMRTWLLGVDGVVSRLVPAPLLGLMVFPSPLGGALRGDYLLVAIMLSVLRRALLWASRRLV